MNKIRCKLFARIKNITYICKIKIINMKTTIQINGKDVEITLTAEQVAQIQKSKEITTLEDAVSYLGDSDKDVIELNKLIKADCNTNFQELVVIVKAINERVVLNWDDDSVKKYYVWFNMQGKGSYDCWDYNCTNSHVPARLCFTTSDKALHFIKYFENKYREYMKK